MEIRLRFFAFYAPQWWQSTTLALSSTAHRCITSKFIHFPLSKYATLGSVVSATLLHQQNYVDISKRACTPGIEAATYLSHTARNYGSECGYQKLLRIMRLRTHRLTHHPLFVQIATATKKHISLFQMINSNASSAQFTQRQQIGRNNIYSIFCVFYSYTAPSTSQPIPPDFAAHTHTHAHRQMIRVQFYYYYLCTRCEAGQRADP